MKFINESGYEMDPKSFKWTVEIIVDPTWVADGFELTEDRAHDMLAHDLQFAHNREIGVRIVKSPSDKRIAKEQGYKTVEEMRAAR